MHFCHSLSQILLFLEKGGVAGEEDARSRPTQGPEGNHIVSRGKENGEELGRSRRIEKVMLMWRG